jgi:hypothetical protein
MSKVYVVIDRTFESTYSWKYSHKILRGKGILMRAVINFILSIIFAH